MAKTISFLSMLKSPVGRYGGWKTWTGWGAPGSVNDIYTWDPAREPRRGAYHSLYVGDLDGDAAPRYYIWENVDGKGGQWQEHVILDANLGGHALVVGNITGNGRPDIIAKPWRPRMENALGGKMFVVFLEGA